MITFKQYINEDPVKKVTSGEYAGRWMVKYIWNRKKQTGIFDNKKDARRKKSGFCILLY